MLAEYKKKTNLFILIGITCNLAGWLFLKDVPLVSLVGSVLFIVGCSYYAKGKGHHGAWGLLGLLNLIGLLILILMSDKHKD